MASTALRGLFITVACFQAASAFAPTALPCLRQTSSVGQRAPATCARPRISHRRALVLANPAMPSSPPFVSFTGETRVTSDRNQHGRRDSDPRRPCLTTRQPPSSTGMHRL